MKLTNPLPSFLNTEAHMSFERSFGIQRDKHDARIDFFDDNPTSPTGLRVYLYLLPHLMKYMKEGTRVLYYGGFADKSQHLVSQLIDHVGEIYDGTQPFNFDIIFAPCAMARLLRDNTLRSMIESRMCMVIGSFIDPFKVRTYVQNTGDNPAGIEFFSLGRSFTYAIEGRPHREFTTSSDMVCVQYRSLNKDIQCFIDPVYSSNVGNGCDVNWFMIVSGTFYAVEKVFQKAQWFRLPITGPPPVIPPFTTASQLYDKFKYLVVETPQLLWRLIVRDGNVVITSSECSCFLANYCDKSYSMEAYGAFEDDFFMVYFVTSCCEKKTYVSHNNGITSYLINLVGLRFARAKVWISMTEFSIAYKNSTKAHVLPNGTVVTTSNLRNGYYIVGEGTALVQCMSIHVTAIMLLEERKNCFVLPKSAGAMKLVVDAYNNFFREDRIPSVCYLDGVPIAVLDPQFSQLDVVGTPEKYCQFMRYRSYHTRRFIKANIIKEN